MGLHTNQSTVKTRTDMLGLAAFKNVFSAGYKECITLSMLLIPMPKHFKVYERADDRFHPGWTSGKIMDRIRFVYSSDSISAH